FEDIDKTDLGHARDLFFEHAATLNSLSCTIIYTFPIALCYSNEFTSRVGDYSRHFLLPNVSLFLANGTQNHEGFAALQKVITARLTEPARDRLFERQALTEMIQLSGGLMRDLVRIIADSALIALTERKAAVSADIVQRVGISISNDFKRLLLP